MGAHRDIDRFLQQEIDAGSFPGAVYAVGSSKAIDHENALGNAVSVPIRLPATLDTLYDCASITKPLITTTLILQAVDRGQLSLDDSIEGFPLRALLTHTSGLRAWLPLYAFGPGSAPPSLTHVPEVYRRAILEQGPEYLPGSRVVYSDLNFVLLWLVLHRVWGDYAAVANDRIFRPLRLRNAMFRPPETMKPRIAATEWSQRWEKVLCADRKLDFESFREGLIWGQTHDGNSHYAGGTAGNAGLFATARAVYALARGWLDGTLVAKKLFDQATTNYTSGLEENRGLGWIMSAAGHDATGMLSPRAFGHTGFTGTSVFVDPERDRIMVLMTNRVHPCAGSVAMQKIRGRFHQLALG